MSGKVAAAITLLAVGGLITLLHLVLAGTGHGRDRRH